MESYHHFCPERHLLVIKALVLPSAIDVAVSFVRLTLEMSGEHLVLLRQGFFFLRDVVFTQTLLRLGPRYGGYWYGFLGQKNIA